MRAAEAEFKETYGVEIDPPEEPDDPEEPGDEPPNDSEEEEIDDES